MIHHQVAKGRYLASMNCFELPMKCPEFRTSYRRASSVNTSSLDCLKVIRWNPKNWSWQRENHQIKRIARWPNFPECSYACSCPGSRELPSFSPGHPKEIGLVPAWVTWISCGYKYVQNLVPNHTSYWIKLRFKIAGFRHWQLNMHMYIIYI